jgi:hypothetical protein
VKDNVHSAFTPEMMTLAQATWIETFVEGVIDKKDRTAHFQGASLVRVQGLWCHVFIVCV